MSCRKQREKPNGSRWFQGIDGRTDRRFRSPGPYRRSPQARRPGGSAGQEAQATSWRIYHTEKSSTSLCSLRSNQRSHATTGSDSLQQPFRLLMALHTVELPVASAMSTLEKISPVYRKLVSLAVLTDGRGMEVSTKGVHSTL